ncbi:hypothetical protein GCM10010387_67480 [Streptomyces inusitatus]|uniref:Holin n=1 Tax=Streptomyces inusitatus TaxID=68221 RepID=A0A918V300_9ACTN|nr:hypothetical protein [Streptomyces inusitatus]GGZ64902.1 hypothetical protein GCM10010387_67480 [Streptomyces inusitatus]
MIPKVTQLFALVVILGGFVALTLKGEDTTSYVSFAGPILAAVFITSRMDQRTDAQDEVLAKISHQTNGVLTQRISEAVNTALDEREKRAPF